MKALTLKEPYATLIKNNIKTIETRSWKTKYRGELYIHAGVSRLSKEIKNNKELMDLVKTNLASGQIICKVNLKDCIYMTKEYIDNIKKNDKNNYISGIYEEGRYAWILDDVVSITPIDAKGQLGLWTYKD